MLRNTRVTPEPLGTAAWQPSIGVLVQMPFISTHFYTGPLVETLGGTDISWILGLIVPAVLYYVGARVSSRSIPERLILPAERGGMAG